jgi:Mce-associated membrane protein
MPDEITDEPDGPEARPESDDRPAAPPESDERPEAAPSSGGDIEAGAVVEVPAVAGPAAPALEPVEDDAPAEDGASAAIAGAGTDAQAVGATGLVRDDGDTGGSPVGMAAASSAAPVATTPGKVKANGEKADGAKPAKTKSPKDKSGKGKVKDKSGKAKSAKGASAGSAPSRSGATPDAGEGAVARDAAGEGDRGRTSLGARSLSVVLGAVAVALAIALVVVILQLNSRDARINGQNAVDSARSSALAAARTYSVELAGYDYRHLDQDFGVVLAHSTASFRASFTQSSDALKATLVKYHATAQATVVAAGLVKATASSAEALVFLDQTVTNSTQKQPTTDRTEVEINLVLSGRSWLINEVTLL